MRRLAILLILAASLAPAYYHFVRYQSQSAPFIPVYDRFDLNALPNKTVPFLISENGPGQLAPGDTTAAVISQIRAAARVWNSVDTADIKVAFGGFYSPDTQMNTPRIEIEFTDELPPGVLAQGGPVSRLDPVAGPNGQFVPIAKSLLRLPRDLSTRPSFTERFFLTVVHEFGHTLGLQHTWTSGVMSTEVTRATSKSKPLSTDDVAGLSVLYPNAKFSSQNGVITGRVTFAGNGVALASVVALAPNQQAISALTQPDGTFRIEGVQPGQYFVYAHPLPPSFAGEPQPVNLELPIDSSGNRISPGVIFDTIFYPGTSTAQQSVFVQASQSTDNINFAVNRRDRVNMYGVQTYSFMGQEAVKPATFTLGSAKNSIILTGVGLTAPLPGLNIGFVSAPETVVPGGIKQYSAGYLQVDVAQSPGAPEGPRHMIFSYNNETYVHPFAMNLVPRDAPSIQTVTSNPDRTITLNGNSLNASTQVWVDGMAAKLLSAQDGLLTVVPPPAPSGYRGILAAFNPDGQSSLYIQGNNSPAYTFDSPEPPQITMTPTALSAGVETMLEFNATGSDFTTWAPVAGFGNSDVSIRRVWAVSPWRALASVVVSPLASPGNTTLTLSHGLVTTVSSGGFQVLPNSRPPYFVTSALPGTPIYSGLALTLNIANAQPSASASSFAVTIADRTAPVLGYLGGQLTVQVPSNIPQGPAIVRATIDGQPVLPAVIVIDPPPPVILSAQTSIASQITLSNAPHSGDSVQLVVSSLGDGVSQVDASRVKVTTGTVDHTVQSVFMNSSQLGTYIVQFAISAASPSQASLPLTISMDGRVSTPYLMPYRP